MIASRLRWHPMSQSQISADSSSIAIAGMEHPLTVKDAAKFLGVSPQTVYLWVERKQVPHLRVMDRNIRFLKIGSRNIPRVIQTGDGECLDCGSTTVPYIGERTHRSGGFGIATEVAYVAPNLHSRKTDRKLKQF